MREHGSRLAQEVIPERFIRDSSSEFFDQCAGGRECLLSFCMISPGLDRDCRERYKCAIASVAPPALLQSLALL